MPKPTFTHYAKSIVPFALSAGTFCAAGSLPHTASAPASPEALIAGLATGLLVNGISALCKLSHFRASAEYHENLVNHDILRLIRNSLADATANALEAYVKGRSQKSIITSVPKEFQHFVEKCKSEKFSEALFSETEINVTTVRPSLTQFSKLWAKPA